MTSMPTDLVLTAAGTDDLDAVMAVMDAAFDPRFGEAWTRAQVSSLIVLPHTRLCLARCGGAPAGFYAARFAAGESELMLLAVDPAARRAGIGRALLDDWWRWASELGAEDYFLEMRADNAALHLYVSFGFAECGRRADYYVGKDGVKRDAITMRYCTQ